jgi:hypothetical protein
LLIQIGSQYSAPVAFDVHDVIPKLEQPPTHLEAFSPSTIGATPCADNPPKLKVQNLTLPFADPCRPIDRATCAGFAVAGDVRSAGGIEFCDGGRPQFALPCHLLHTGQL